MNASALVPLPPPLTEVEIPRMLSPSRMTALEACTLRAVASMDAVVLPTNPKALLGTALHRTMQDLGASSLDWESVLQRFHHHCKDIVRLERGKESGLRELVGFVAWNSATSRLRKWFDAQPDRTPPDPSGTQVLSRHGSRTLFGNEIWLESPSLRLQGRVDRIESSSTGEIIITDYKAGSILDYHGNPREEYLHQLTLYGLLVRERLGLNQGIRLVLSGATQHEVAFGKKEEEAARSRLSAALATLPEEKVGAASLAHPGPMCVWCQLRPRCSAYLAEAPRTWPAPEYRLPNDCWGRVEGQTGEAVTLRSNGGLLFRVHGVAWSLGNGEYPLFFSLQSNEVSQIGRHPRNYNFVPDRGSAAYRLGTNPFELSDPVTVEG